jgi:hypothetical protein
MKARTKFSVALIGAAVFSASLIGSPATAAKKAKVKVVGKDDVGDWGANVDPQVAPLGDALGQDLVGASIGMADKKTVNFIIKVNSLPPTGGVPEVARYWWDFSVGKNVFELDGKFTNYSRGACDPTSGQCPPPRDPGMQPFLLRGNCGVDPAAGSVTTCEELGLVQATFDTAKATITIPVPLKLLKAKPGTKIGPAASLAAIGGPITAAPAAFVTNASMPLDSMAPTGTFVIPKK